MSKFKKYLLAFVIICNALFSLAQPANDECTTAIDLGSNYFAYTSTSAAFTNAGATASSMGNTPQPACFNGQNDRDVWFRFTTDNTNLDLALIVRGAVGGLSQPQVAIYRGHCPTSIADVEISCSFDIPNATEVILPLTGLDPMETYYIRINDWSATGTPNAGAFGITMRKNWLLNDDYTPASAGSITDTVGIVMDSGSHGNPGEQPLGTNYTAADNYTMVINPPITGCLSIRFDYFKVAQGTILKIYDGATATGAPIGTLNGNNTHTTLPLFICPSGKATIVFEAALLSLTDEGFVMSWSMRPSCASFSPCDAQIFDNGGVQSNYTTNTTTIETFCPAIPNTQMSMDFSFIDIHTGDLLCVFDGNSVASPLLGCINDVPLHTSPHFNASAANTQGCLTLQFYSDSSDVGGGYAAHLHCQRQCQRIVPIIDTNNLAVNPTHTPLVMPGDSGINIIVGTTVTVSASATYPDNNIYYHQEDSTSIYTINWGDGFGTTMIGNTHTASHTYRSAGIFFIRVKVSDPDSICTAVSTNFQRIRVARRPTTTLTRTDLTSCLGQADSLFAGISNYNNYQVACYWPTTPILHHQGQFCLPDGMTLDYPIFVEYMKSSVITPTCGLKAVSAKFQHSFAGDLSIEIICPTGQSAMLKSYPGGSSNYFGLANDNQSSCSEPAAGLDYRWTNQNPDFNYTTNQAFSNGTLCNPQNIYMGTPSSTLCPGSYLPVTDISGAASPLLGCPINGTWKLRFSDHLGADNGICYEYGIEFDDCVYYPYPEFYYVEIDSIQSGWHTAPDLAIQAPIHTPITHTYPAIATPTTAGMHDYVFATKYFNFPEFTDSIQIMANVPPVLSMLHDTTFCTGTVSFSAAQVAATCPVTQNYFALSGVPIPDNTGVSLRSSIEVTGQTCNMITGGLRQVRIDITHSKTSDLTIYLVSPTGTQILLTQNNGTGANYTNTTFTSYSTNLPLINQSQNPFTGEFRAQGNLMNGFTNYVINGTWQLVVKDNVSGNTGTLNNWSISFDPPDTNTYQWSDGSTTPTITVLPDVATTYSVTVTNVAGCSATGSARAIPDSLGTLALRTATTPDIYGAHNGTARVYTCGGTQRVLAYTYQWSNGQTTREITGLTAGAYTVTVTSPNGSTQSTVAVVAEVLVPVVSVISTAFAENVSVQPNPTDGMLRLTANLMQNKPVWVDVRNVYGQLLQTEKLAGSTKIDVLVDLSSYANGVYLLTLRNEEGQITLKTALNR